MIVLHPSGEQDFDCLGLGSLQDAIQCTVTEEKNGPYELEMVYPISGRRASDIQVDRIITAPPRDMAKVQPFRIYAVTPSVSAGTITVKAEHISYMLNHIPVRPFQKSGASAAMAALSSNAVISCPFSFSTDIADTKSYDFAVPLSVRQLLLGASDSISAISKGELEFDRYNVVLHGSRGSDTGVIVSYGKNLEDMEREINIQELVTGYYPYWSSGDEYVDGPLVTLEYVDWSYPRVLPLNLSSQFSTKPTQSQLKEAATAKLGDAIVKSVVSDRLSFIPLWLTEQYKNAASMDRVGLCDTIHIKVEALHLDARAQIVRTVYNVLTGRYDSMEIGTAKSTLDRTLAGMMRKIREA